MRTLTVYPVVLYSITSMSARSSLTQSLQGLLMWGLVAWIQKRIFLGFTYAMGFDGQPHTLISLIGDVLALHHICPLAAPTFLLLGVLAGGPWIQKMICQSGACYMGFGPRPWALILFMGGALVLLCRHPLAAPLFCLFGVLKGGLQSLPPLLHVIMGGLPPPPLHSGVGAANQPMAS
jgi:hypothetical protein